MARAFGGALGSARVVVPAYAAMDNLSEFTMNAWTLRRGTDACRHFEKKGGTVATNEHSLQGCSATSVTAERWTGIGIWTWNTPTTLNAWVHMAATYSYSATTNDPILYFDGVDQGVRDSETTPTGSVNIRTPASMILGNNAGTPVRAYDGDMAEMAMWSVVLTSNEVKSLAAGISPLRVRPGSLVLYLPLQGIASPEPNYAGPNNGTVTGTTQASHAPIAPPFGVDDAGQVGF